MKEEMILKEMNQMIKSMKIILNESNEVEFSQYTSNQSFDEMIDDMIEWKNNYQSFIDDNKE